MNSIKQKFTTNEEPPHEEYIEALVYLLSEICGSVYDAEVKGVPWYPCDEEKFNWMKNEIEKHDSKGGGMCFVHREWPKPGEIPPPTKEITDEERNEARRKVQELDKPGAGAVEVVLVRLYRNIFGV